MSRRVRVKLVAQEIHVQAGPGQVSIRSLCITAEGADAGEVLGMVLPSPSPPALPAPTSGRRRPPRTKR
jgi:hypothetical protein